MEAKMALARIGVVGAGWWACEFHIPHLLKNSHADLVAVSRLGKEELDKIQQRFEIQVASENHLELYAHDLDGVIVASPHVLHEEHASAAIENGCHVLVEKPMTTDIEGARRLHTLVEGSGKTLMTPYGLNHTHYMEKAADWVKEERIGEVRHIMLHMSSALLDLFGGEPMLETKDHLYRPPPSTWADPSRAGGYGWGQMSHALAALFCVCPVEPVSVRGVCSKSPTGVDYFDAAIVEFEKGATASLSGAAGLPKHSPPQLELRLYGSEGMLLLDVEEGRERLTLSRFDEEDLIHEIGHGGGYGSYTTEESVNRFVEICRGEPARNCGDHEIGLKTIQVLDAMYHSFESGEKELCR